MFQLSTRTHAFLIDGEGLNIYQLFLFQLSLLFVCVVGWDGEDYFKGESTAIVLYGWDTVPDYLM